MKTQELLKLTNQQYEMLLFEAYGKWCESVTGNLRQYQECLANSSVNKWYLIELGKCEREFHLLVSRYDNLSVKDITKLYAECTHQMFNIRPKSLLDEFIKKNQIQGVQIFTSLISN